MQDLKNLSPEQKQKVLDQVNTEVVSVASEEAKTGTKMVIPEAEKLVAMASMSLIRCKRDARNMMINMSKREIVRAVSAFLDLPQEGLPVMLRTDAEKLLFVTGQRAISDRYIIVTHHINQQIIEERLKKAQLEQQQKEEVKSDGEAVQETK